MTNATKTRSIFGNICDYQTGDVLRPATAQDWLRAREQGDAGTGAHRDDDGNIVFCDGPEELTVDMARELYRSVFSDAADAFAVAHACAWVNQIGGGA